MAISIDGSIGRLERQSVSIEEPHYEVRIIDLNLYGLLDALRSPFQSVSQSRSRSVENLVDGDPKEHCMMNSHSSIIEQQRARSPNRSIEALTHRVISSIGTHRQSTDSTPRTARNPALTIKKQPLSTQTVVNGHTARLTESIRMRETNASTVLDFREISSLGFRHTSKSSLVHDESEGV